MLYHALACRQLLVVNLIAHKSQYHHKSYMSTSSDSVFFFSFLLLVVTVIPDPVTFQYIMNPHGMEKIMGNVPWRYYIGQQDISRECSRWRDSYKAQMEASTRIFPEASTQGPSASWFFQQRLVVMAAIFHTWIFFAQNLVNCMWFSSQMRSHPNTYLSTFRQDYHTTARDTHLAWPRHETCVGSDKKYSRRYNSEQSQVSTAFIHIDDIWKVLFRQILEAVVKEGCRWYFKRRKAREQSKKSKRGGHKDLVAISPSLWAYSSDNLNSPAVDNLAQCREPRALM